MFFFLTGCSTIPTKTLSLPSANRLEVLKNSLISNSLQPQKLSSSEAVVYKYLSALKAEEEGKLLVACDYFRDLSENKSLPIKEVALLHVLNDCDLSNRELKKIWKKTKISKYLKEAFIEQSLNLSIQKKLLPFEAQFSYELVTFKNAQAEKVKLLKRALAITQELNDEENTVIYQNKLKEISPLYNTDINAQNIYSVARDFEVNRNFEKARILYEQIISGEFTIEEVVKAYNSYRLSFKVERNLKMFLLKTSEMENFLKKKLSNNTGDLKTQEYWVDSKINLTRAIWTDHQSEEALSLLKELILTDFGSTNQKANMQFIFGSLLMEKKENKKAMLHFEKASHYEISDLALSENCQWAVVWNNYLLKRNIDVVKSVDQFVSRSSNSNFVSKLNYWKAKSLQRQKRFQDANEVFKSINDSDPFGYYGILSTIDLKIPLTPLASDNVDYTRGIDNNLDWLIALNEKAYSLKYLKDINSTFKTFKARENAMPLYLATNWYQGGMRQIANLNLNSRNKVTEKYISVIYPTPYIDLIEKFSNKYGIPSELILAISRQESAFVSSERSWADAFGLLQLIPEKALELSGKYKIPYNNYNDLYNPETNIELGAALLKNLSEKFDFKFAQTVASYNASTAAIHTWEKERFNGDYFEFIEMIPYEETRNYIKLVFRNYITYKRISSKKSFSIKKDFFEVPFN
jgi:soluble lytic murein transglycosylase